MLLTGGDVISGLLQTVDAPIWNSGLVARSTANNGVYDRVLKYAGARPIDRDVVDRRIVHERQEPQRPDHQLRVVERHDALQQERRWLAALAQNGAR